jgi:hypothetical protein
MQLLIQYSNGMWVLIEEDRIDEYIDKILGYEQLLTDRFGTENRVARLEREQLKTKTEVINYLKTGKPLSYDDEWYANIKMDMPKKPKPPVEMVKCNCGHTVPKCSVMSTSTGSSCPDCYDRMSM